jgi:hypothetical protein
VSYDIDGDDSGLKSLGEASVANYGDTPYWVRESKIDLGGIYCYGFREGSIKLGYRTPGNSFWSHFIIRWWFRSQGCGKVTAASVTMENDSSLRSRSDSKIVGPTPVTGENRLIVRK